MVVLPTTRKFKFQTSGRGMQEGDDIINLSQLIGIKLVRGDIDSLLEDEKFDYDLEVLEFTQLHMKLQVNFDDPCSISTGSSTDKLQFNITHPQLLKSEETLLSVKEGTVLSIDIPRQAPDAFQYNLIKSAAVTATAITDTAFAIQIVQSLLMSISLQSLWNLMNTIQVVTYFRLMANWPANIKLFFEAVYQAAYLDYIYDWLFEYTGERYERLDELTSDESIRKAGI